MSRRSKLALSFELDAIRKRLEQESITAGQILGELSHRSYALVCLLLCLPFFIPIPMFGISTLFGGMILAAATGLIFNKKPWLPKKWRNQPLPQETLLQLMDRIEGYAMKLEKWVHPRWLYFAGAPFFVRLHGLMIGFAAFVLALPAPPGGNLPPALAIFFICLGMLEDDGPVILIGYILTLLNLIVVGLILVYGLGWLLEFYQRYV